MVLVSLREYHLYGCGLSAVIWYVAGKNLSRQADRLLHLVSVGINADLYNIVGSSFLCVGIVELVVEFPLFHN